MAAQQHSQHSQQTETLLDVSHQDEDEATPEKGEYRDSDSLHQTSSTDSGSPHGHARGPVVEETQFLDVIADSLPQRLAAEAAAAALDLGAQNGDDRVSESSGRDNHADAETTRSEIESKASKSRLKTHGPNWSNVHHDNDDEDLYTVSPGAARSTTKIQLTEMVPSTKPRSSLVASTPAAETTTLFVSQTHHQGPVGSVAPATREVTGVVITKSGAAERAISDLLEGGAVAGTPSSRSRHVGPFVTLAAQKAKNQSEVMQEDELRQSSCTKELAKAGQSGPSASTKPVRKRVQDLYGDRPKRAAKASALDALRARKGIPPSSTRTDEPDDPGDKTYEPAARKTNDAATDALKLSKKSKQLPTPASNPAASRTTAAMTTTGKLSTHRMKPPEDPMDAAVGSRVGTGDLARASATMPVTESRENTVASSARKPGALKRPNKATGIEQPSKRRKGTFDVPSDENAGQVEASQAQRRGVAKDSKPSKAVPKPAAKERATVDSAPDRRRRERSQSHVSIALTGRSVLESRTRQRMAEISTKAPNLQESRHTKASIARESNTAKVLKERAPLPKQHISGADKENVDPTVESYEDFEDTVVQYEDDRPGQVNTRDEDVDAQAQQPDAVRSVSGRSGSTVIDLESQADERVLPLVISKPDSAAPRAIASTEPPSGNPVKVRPAATEFLASRPARTLARPQTPSVLPSSPPQRTREVRESRKPQVIAFDDKGPCNQGTPSFNVHSATSTRVQKDQSRYTLRSTPANKDLLAPKQVPEIRQANVANENEDVFAAFLPGRPEDVRSSPAPGVTRRACHPNVKREGYGNDEVPSVLETEDNYANIDDFEGTTLVESADKDAQPTASQVAMPPPGGRLEKVKKAHREPAVPAALDHQGTEPSDIQDARRGKRRALQNFDRSEERVTKRHKKDVTNCDVEELELGPTAEAKTAKTGSQSGLRSSAAQPSASSEQTQLLELPSKLSTRSVEVAQLSDDAARPQPQKQSLCDALYSKVHAQYPEIAEKLTGMLLQIDYKDIVILTTDDDALRQHVTEVKRIHDNFIEKSNSQISESQPQTRPVVLPVNRRRTRVVRQASQGSQRVDMTGSPIPKGINVPPRGTAVGTFLSQSKMSSDEALDSRVAEAKIDDGLGLPLNDHHLAPPSAQPRNIMSSNTKPVPAAPYEESRAITRRVSGADAAKLVTQRERSDPFNLTDDQNSGETAGPFTTGFKEKLRQQVGDLVSSGESQPANGEVPDEDPDMTLVEPAAPPAKRSAKQPANHVQATVKRVISISSNASTSDSDISSMPSTDSSQEDDSIATWRKALEPHQGSLFDALVVVSHKLVKHIVDQETAASDTLNDYRLQGEKVVEMLEQSHLEAYEKQAAALEKHKRKMKKKLKCQGEELASVVEQLAGQREKSRFLHEEGDELGGKLGELMSMVA
ncbi:hypothetical protein B0A48_07177 [Cryoendolithus antarcticus]|uniref:PABC domain-containing protein n=1 Tax=Cryoendolithus antarcticus TaxID=1507870 RepID=A0A1V8T7Z5_9PEZI|nr:hypothetical protein B0A48_07177 [Cryoendolithus antarcticus]